MIQQLIHKFLLRRHFWRHATFSEVGELYASRMMRIFALRLVSIFTSIYLLQEGYSLIFIGLLWAGFYFMKVIFSWPAARLIADLGPKHASLVSNIVSAVAMGFLPFASHPEYGVWALIAWVTLQAYSSCMNDMAYLVDFSKVKNMQHAGKEIGYMNIVEKVATGASPFVGGIMAFVFGPETIMVLSAVLFLLSAVPLFATAEPVATRQRLNFRGFPWRTTWRSLVAETAIGVDVYATGIAWSLYIAIIVFGFENDQVYAEVGFVTSIALFIAIIASYGFGRLIDSKRGGELLQYTTLLNSAVHALRTFVVTPFSVVIINVVNEATTTGYAMPFLRGLFDTADRSGKREEYLYLIEMAVNFGACLASLALTTLFYITDQTISFYFFFLAAGLTTVLIGVPRFILYRR